MLTTDLYIVCLDLTERRALVVGAGPMAEEKVAALRAANARVDVVAPGNFDAAMLDDAYLVVAVTEDRALGERIYAEAEARAMFVNVADVPNLCNFILPAIARSGPISVAVSTSGASPALAQRIRREVAAHIGDEYARLAAKLDGLRDWAKTTLPTYEARRDFFRAIVDAEPDPIELLRGGRDEEVDRAIQAAQRRAVLPTRRGGEGRAG